MTENGQPWICGGLYETDKTEIFKNCWIYDETKWIASNNFSYTRAYASSSQIHRGQYIITGGIGMKGDLRIGSERFSNKVWFYKSFWSKTFNQHCQVLKRRLLIYLIFRVVIPFSFTLSSSGDFEQHNRAFDWRKK